MIDDTNHTTNYKCYHTQDINRTARSLSTEQRQRLLDQIQLKKGAHNFFGREYNRDDCERIEKILKGETK